MRLSGLLHFLLVAGVFWPTPVSADAPIEAEVTAIENKFPDEVAFTAEATSSEGEVRSLVLRVLRGSGPAQGYGTFEFTPSQKVQSQFTLKTGGNSFVPAGTDITYWLDVEDSAGNRLETEKSLFLYADTRFEWSKLQDGPVTVFYYGGAERNAKLVMDAASGTREKVGKMLGTETRPFKVMLYNSVPDIVGAQPAELSQVRRREIIRAGISYSGSDLVQVLGVGSIGAGDTARHEIAHLFVHWAAGVNVPTWLNEGLAVWAQSDPGFEYTRALERGIEDDKLLLLRGMDSFPGRSDETILAYGQAYSVVIYLVDTYGPEQMRRLMEAIGAGDGVVQGLEDVYGLTLDRLDAEWRKRVGAPPRSYESAAPTPIAFPTIAPIGAEPVPPPAATPLSDTEASEAEKASEAATLPPLLIGIAAFSVVLLLLVAGATLFTLARRRV